MCAGARIFWNICKSGHKITAKNIALHISPNAECEFKSQILRLTSSPEQQFKFLNTFLQGIFAKSEKYMESKNTIAN
jgi:hypothetical protein